MEPLRHFVRFSLLLLLFCSDVVAQPSTGQDMKRLTLYQGHDLTPAWDPAGSRIAYVRLKENTTSVYDGYVVDSSSQGGEQPYLIGLNQDFGAVVNVSWIGSTGFLGVEEAISGFEVLKFDPTSAPFNRTVANGGDAANSVLLSIDGGGGGGLMKFSRDGNTALTRFSSSGSAGFISVRVGSVSGMTGGASSQFGTTIISQNAGGDGRFYNGGSLSPDGTQVAISYPTVLSSLNPHDLFYGPSTSQVVDYTNLTNSAADSITNIFPDISPDGTRIVFSRGLNGASNQRDLYLINVDGTGLTQLTDTPNFSELNPSWSPDGTAIVFSGLHTGDVTSAPALMAGETANHNIYRLQLSAATGGQVVTPKTTLLDPPFVEISGNSVTFTLVPFIRAEKKSATAMKILEASKDPKLSFTYLLEIKKDGGKKKDLIQKTSKKNEITVKNLKSGSYSARYRVEIFKKDKGQKVPAGRTKFSPSANFTVPH